MVNAAKRMRALTQVLSVKTGPGAIVLPPAPKPQVQQIYMRLPTGTYRGREYYAGARDFWRGHLQRLKFANPSLHCAVETVRTGENEPLYLSITYDSPDRDALSKLDLKFPKALARIHPEVKTRTEGDAQIQEPSPLPKEVRDLPNPNAPQPKPKTLPPIHMTPEILSHAPKDEVKPKPQAPSDPSTPQTTTPPETVYTRTVTLPLGGLRDNEIWLWIRQQLKIHHKKGLEGHEAQEWIALKDHRSKAEQDRRRVKEGVDAMKKEQTELKRAREAAARMAAEA